MLSSTKFGRFQVVEPMENLACLHRFKGETLTTVDHEPKNSVLDQEDLLAQGIHVSSFIPSATDVDALGSCTANATTSALSQLLDTNTYLKLTGATGYTDTVGLEKWAITFYHGCTDQTGDPSSEWPPTDCGSSGPYIVQYLQKLGVVSSASIAHGAQDVASLLQRGPVLMGSPWFNAWEEPDSNGFIDAAGLEAAIQSGVAGGHETVLSSIEKIGVSQTGVVLPDSTVIRGRNSWTSTWGDNGDYRVKLSTLAALGQYCDFRQLVK